jgi:hypothetical protein
MRGSFFIGFIIFFIFYKLRIVFNIKEYYVASEKKSSLVLFFIRLTLSLSLVKF